MSLPEWLPQPDVAAGPTPRNIAHPETGSMADRRRRIVHVVEPFATGPLYAIGKICCALSGSFEFAVVHGVRRDVPAQPGDLFPSGVRFVPWRAQREISLWGDSQALLELRRLLAKLKPDVVHAHSSKAGALVRLAALSMPLDVVYSPHSYGFLQKDAGGVRRALYFAAEAALGRIPHLTVACGNDEYAQALRVARRVKLVPNMIDLADFEDPKPISRSAEHLVVAMCGEIRPQKNFPLFCEIARLCTADRMRFVWLGGGRLPDHVALPDNLTVSGWLSRRGLLRELRKAHAFCQTSLWEGLPISVLEAMATGLPVLAYPAIGNGELVVEGENGYLCRDAGEFAKRLRELAADEPRRVALGHASRRSVERHYDARMLAPLWESIYTGRARDPEIP